MTLRVICAIPVCVLLSHSTALADDVVDFAARMIGKPYVWGAEGPNSFDCSGLTQYVFEKFGISLPRRAVQQSRVGDRTGRLQRGDLLFFSTDTRRSLVTHVGVYEGNGVMIDASKRHGRVRRDSLRDDYWADRFMFARRINGAVVTGLPDGRDDQPGDRRRSSNDKRRIAVRILEGIAGELFKIPR